MSNNKISAGTTTLADTDTLDAQAEAAEILIAMRDLNKTVSILNKAIVKLQHKVEHQQRFFDTQDTIHVAKILH